MTSRDGVQVMLASTTGFGGTLILEVLHLSSMFFFFQAEDGIRDIGVTGVQTCALPISEVVAPYCARSRQRPRDRIYGRRPAARDRRRGRPNQSDVRWRLVFCRPKRQ